MRTALLVEYDKPLEVRDLPVPLAEGATQLKMHGRYVPVRAEVVVDDGFSAHADGPELVDWVRLVRRRARTR